MTTLTLNHASPALGLRELGDRCSKGLLALTHNGLALFGTAVVLLLIVFATNPGLRAGVEQHTLNYLLERQLAGSEVTVDPTAAERVTAAQPEALPQAQARVVDWLSRRYRVAPAPLAALVAEAYEVGDRVKLDPKLILAVMAIESRFNPYAQSTVGAQGLMQVLTRVHTDKYDEFGGTLAAFDPLSNLRVGVLVLRDCVRRNGSVEGGLRCYVGAVSSDGSDYINKVLAEHQRITRAATGQREPIHTPRAPRPAQTVAAAT